LTSNLISWLIKFDQKAVKKYENLIAKGKYTGLQTFCRWIGLPVQMSIAYLVVGICVYFIGGWRLIILEVITIVLTNIVNLRIKALFKRVRPPLANFESPLPDDEYAFPSGHAATTMSLAISLGLQTGGFMLVLLIWAVFMGISRFFGEFHHPTDIPSGFAVGIISGFVIQYGYVLVG